MSPLWLIFTPEILAAFFLLQEISKLKKQPGMKVNEELVSARRNYLSDRSRVPTLVLFASLLASAEAALKMDPNFFLVCIVCLFVFMVADQLFVQKAISLVEQPTRAHKWIRLHFLVVFFMAALGVIYKYNLL